MFPADNINNILKELLSRYSPNVPGSSNICPPKPAGGKLGITPSQAIVIGGILGGVLNIESVLVDKNQTVEIVLSGSLKKKTVLEKMLDQVGSMPFDEVIKTMLERLTEK
jgi:hypothetical protein